MAKKKQFELDEFGFDADLEIPDFSFDGGEIKDDRKAVTKIASGVKDGMKDSVMSPSFIRKMIKNSLPQGYGEAMNLADESAGTLKNLYNDAAKEAKPVVKDLKRVTKRLLPATEAVLPRKMAAKLKKWSETDSDYPGGMNAEQMREASLQAQLGDIFKFQAEQQQQDKAENETRETVRDSVQHERHRDMLGQLDAMRISLQQLAGYQEKVDSAYKRKSLELQFRHYFVAVDQLEEQKKFNAEARTQLEGIMKNTGLPEFVKLKNSERLHEAIRNKFIDGVQETIFSKRRALLGNFGKKLSASAMDKMRGFMDNFQSGIQMADGVADMRDMQADMAGMGGPSREEMGGQVIGSLAADSLGKRAGKGVRKLINKYDSEGRVDKFGNKLQHGVENMPQLMTEYARSDKHETGGFFDGLVRTVKEAILSAQIVDNGLQSDSLRGMQDPMPYNRSAHKSLTEIIPGYLARLLREAQMARTGSDSVELTTYDFMSGKFVDRNTLKSKVFKSIVSDSDKEYTKKQIDDILKEIDPDGTKLDEQERKVLGQYLMSENLKNGYSGSKKLTSYDSFTGKAGRYADKFSTLFGDYFEDSEKGAKDLRFSRMFNRLGSNISDSRGVMQDHVNTGNRDMLEELGLLTPGSDGINMNRLYSYFFGDEDMPVVPGQPQPAGNGDRRKRRRPRNRSNVPALPAPSPTLGPTPPVTPTPFTVEPNELIETIKRSGEQTVNAIKEESTKSLSEKINDTLIRIEERINQGLTISGGPGGAGGSSGEQGRWWQRSLGSLGSSALGAGRRGLSAARDFAGSVGSQIWGNMGKLGGFAKGLGEKAIDRAKKYNDVYVQGEIVPRLQALKLKAGDHYYVIENGTKKYIKELRDISGDVFGPDGNLVMSLEDAKKAWTKVGPIKKLLSAATKVRDFGARAVGQAFAKLPGIYGIGMDLAKKVYDVLLDGPQDVYVQGKPDPVLLAVTMRVGGYASRITSKEIRKVSDIDGPVIDSTGNVVLSQEDLAKGLLNKHGKPLRTGLGKIVGTAKDLFSATKDRLTKFGKGAWDKTTNLFKGMGEWFKGAGGIHIGTGMFSGNSIGGGGSTKLLMQIRNLLNERLPGEPTTFNDTDIIRDTMGSMKEKGKGLFALGAKGLGNAKTRLLRGARGLQERAKSMFGSFAKKDGLEVSGMTKVADVLAEMRDRMPAVPKKVVGDLDGDGIRDGSFMDTLRRKKDALRDKLPFGNKQDGEAGLLAKMGGIKGLIDKMRGKKEEEEEEEEDGFLEDAAENAAGEVAGDMLDGDGKKKKRRGAKGKRGRLGRFGSKAKGAIGKIGLKGAGKMLGVAGAAYGAYSAYDNFKQGNYGEAALDAGMSGVGIAASMGGLGAIATAGGSLLAGAAGLISAPLVLGALAVGGLGYLAYKAYTKKRLDAFSKVRYAQYGFLPTDEDHLQAVLGLEDELVKGLTFSAGVAGLDEKKIDFKDVVKKFDIDLEDQEAVAKWLKWFLERFKPVYLVHMSALNKVAPQSKLDGVASLKPEQQKEYLNIAKYPSGPYDVTVSPFKDLKSLKAGPTEVKAMVELAEAEINKGKGGASSAGAGTLGAVAAVTPSAAAAARTTNQTNKPGQVSNGVLSTIVAGSAASASGMENSRGVISTMGVPLSANQFATGRIAGLPAVRYKTYGLKELVLDKVRALDALEKYVAKKVTWEKGNVAKWEGSVEDALMAMGPAFGVDAGTNNNSSSWLAWFSQRFLPIYMNYLTAIATATNKTDIDSAYTMLKPQQLVDVAMIVYTTNGSMNGSSVSVWQIPSSPWPYYELNSDVKSVEVNVNGLKEEAKRTVLDEQKGKIPKGQDAQGNPSANPTSFLGGVASKVTSAVTSAWQGMKNTVSGMFGGPSAPATNGGRDILQPGNGTGGDINSIPKPTGNKTWSALKDTIIAAAKMVGVDEKLMATMAAIESGFDYTVKSASSSATGLYQFVNGTWQWMLKKFGAKYGIAPNTPQTDPRANALMGAEYLKNSVGVLQPSMKRPITDTDVYMAHFLGPGGAKQFLNADPNAAAANVLPQAARANVSIFYDKAGRPRTVAEVYELMNQKVRSRGKQFGVDAGSEGIKVAATPPGVTSGKGDTPPPASATGKATGAAAPQSGAPTSVTAMGAPAPSKVSNALAVPVSDQAPGVPATSAAKATVPAQTATAKPIAGQPVSADVAAMGSGFMSPRARDHQAQSQFQRDSKDEILGNIETVAKQSLDVAKDQLKMMTSIRDAILQGGRLGQPAPAKETPQQVQMKPGSQAMPRAPVSMGKPAW